MIKSEFQKNRTLEQIKAFKKELEIILNSPEYSEGTKDIYRNSYGAMISSLKNEIREYEELKVAKFELPTNITFIELLKNLTKIRISRGLSQQDLANMIGISRQKINLYEEHDYQNVKIDKINAILQAFNINLDMKIAA